MSKKSLLIVGGGWSGCAAAIQAAKKGMEVTIFERTDMLLGTGLVGGIMRNNGRFTATEEMINLGAGDLFKICDENSRHKNVDFPGHKHANLYDISKIHKAVYDKLKEYNIKIMLKKRIIDVVVENNTLLSIKDQNGEIYSGDVFIDATGTAGPQNNCTKHGRGCAMCVLRCPSFGGRKSLSGLCGISEMTAVKKDGSMGAMSGSCKLLKESLSEEIQLRLNNTGVAVIPIPQDLISDKRDLKACQQYASKEFSENVVLLDTGHAKLMTPYYDLDSLKKIPGFENARYEDPYSGGLGNSMRYFDICPHDEFLKATGINNLFCSGEKAGPLVGHTEAIVTGTLAGYNSYLFSENKELFTYPSNFSIGDALIYLNEQLKTPEALSVKITFSGSVYFNRMIEKNLYETNPLKIEAYVKDSGLFQLL